MWVLLLTLTYFVSQHESEEPCPEDNKLYLGYLQATESQQISPHAGWTMLVGRRSAVSQGFKPFF